VSLILVAYLFHRTNNTKDLFYVFILAVHFIAAHGKKGNLGWVITLYYYSERYIGWNDLYLSGFHNRMYIIIDKPRLFVG